MNKDILIDENAWLCCPKCCYNYLHQTWVQVVFRDKEDHDGTIVAVNSKGIIKKRLKDKEIPGRRDIVFIKFECEGCQKNSILKIQQHKGNTIIEWEK